MECENGGYLTSHCKSCKYWFDDSWDFGCGYVYFDKCPHLQKAEIEKPKTQHIYVYHGPIFIFDRCINTYWRGATRAVSEKKAISNLTYQWKKTYGYAPNTKVSLPGQITRIE